MRDLQQIILCPHQTLFVPPFQLYMNSGDQPAHQNTYSSGDSDFGLAVISGSDLCSYMESEPN